jgi:exopolysaccharide biosynthesis predicted pyruvyltransferase EpsI
MDMRFVVFCREVKSYNYLVSMDSKAKIILDHDMAFRMQKDILNTEVTVLQDEREVMNNVENGMKKIGSIAKFIRTDCESVGEYKTATDFDLSLATYVDLVASRNYIDFNAKLMLCVVDSVDAVITDRLHVGIAGALMGKQVYMLDNNYGKLSGVFERTIKPNPRVHFVSEIPKDLHPKRTTTGNLKHLIKNNSVQ